MLVRTLIESLEHCGVSRHAYLEAARLSPERIADASSRISLAEYDRLQALALDLTGDASLGLRMGEHVALTNLDVLGFLSSQASTIREGLTAFVRFHKLLSDCKDSILVELDDVARFRYEFPRSTERCNRLRAEFGMTLLLRAGQRYVGARTLARRVYFEHEAPPYASEYARIFQGAERFGHEYTAIEFDRELLDQQQLHKNPELYRVLEARAQRKIRSLDASVSLAEKLCDYLAEQDPTALPDMDQVARHFGMSARSLRRRLRDEGKSYGVLLGDVLGKTACEMLGDGDQTIQETAYALGFSDTSAFHRAFKRWTGLTPKQYKATLGQRE
jgi:AraC-like DNA-binding protein